MDSTVGNSSYEVPRGALILVKLTYTPTQVVTGHKTWHMMKIS